MEDLTVWHRVLRWFPEDQRPSKRFRYSDRLILMVELWAALHDRPVKWACNPAHWPDAERPAGLPHPSTVSRRSRGPELQQRRGDIHRRSVEAMGLRGRYAALDGRPLLVGGASKDSDARAGRAVGGLGKGYKLHALVTAGRAFAAFEIHPLNVAEPTVARRLLVAAPPALNRILADGLFDSGRLHAVARQTHRRLYTPIRQGRVGRRQQPRRLRLLRLLRHPVGRRLMASRDEIDRTFGHSSNLGFGFKGLPAWVRRQHRVERWMWCKIMLYHAYLALRPSAA
jgi:hypothetical protein